MTSPMIGVALVAAALPLHQATVTGVVRDSVSLEPVASVRVTVTPSADEAAGVSDRFGAFVVPGVPASGPVRVEARALGYAAWIRSYDPAPSEPVSVLLRPAPIGLEGLEASAGARPGDPLSISRGAFVIDSALVRRLPAILETDILRATALSPSASAPSDYVSVPFIRGGASYGTPVLLDGVRLFNPFHVGGFVSAVNTEVVERATVLAGAGGDGFEVGSLSGAFDINTRDGSRDGMRIAGGLGLASLRLSVEGPVGENASYLVAGRRTWIDGLTYAIAKTGAADSAYVGYFFHDIHAKATADLGGISRLSVRAYTNFERLDDSEYGGGEGNRHLTMDWGNSALSVHYRTGVGTQGIVVDATLGRGRFVSDLTYLTGPPPDTGLIGRGSMSETSSRLTVTANTRTAKVVAGVLATRLDADHDFQFHGACCTFNSLGGVVDLEDYISPLRLQAARWRLGTHARVELPLRGGFSARGGLRVDRFAGLTTTLSPLAEMSYTASWWDARVSAARSRQIMASLRNEESLAASFLAFDLLAPVSEPPVPGNTELSVGWEGWRGQSRVRLDAYSRTLDNIRLPSLAGNPLEADLFGDPALRRKGSGRARGVEVTWSWLSDQGLSALGTYRWAKVSRTVGSQSYTPRFHRDHELEFGASYRYGTRRYGNSSLSAQLSLRSGQPVTAVFAQVGNSVRPVVEGDPFDIHWRLGRHRKLLLGEYNIDRLRRYARIDVGWRHRKDVSWFGGAAVTIYASVANLLNRANVVGWKQDDFAYTLLPQPLPAPDSFPSIDKVYARQLPVVPSFGAEFRF